MKCSRFSGTWPIAIGAVAALMQASPALAACNIFTFATAQPLVERFVFRPETLLRDFNDGGPPMVSQVLIIAASSRTALQPLSRQVPRASQRQREAIAAGLAIAAKVCATKGKDQSQAIMQVARDITDATFQREFRKRYEANLSDSDIDVRGRALADSLGPQQPDDAGRNSLFNSRDPGPVRPLGPIAPIPSTIPPVR